MALVGYLKKVKCPFIKFTEPFPWNHSSTESNLRFPHWHLNNAFAHNNVEKRIDHAICSYLVHAPTGLENGPGFINLNKLNKRFALVTPLPFSKKWITTKGATKLRDPVNKRTEGSLHLHTKLTKHTTSCHRLFTV